MKKKNSIESRDLGYRSVVFSYEEASALKLLVSAKLAELYYAKCNSLPYNDKYFDQLFRLNQRLDNFVYIFVEDLPF